MICNSGLFSWRKYITECFFMASLLEIITMGYGIGLQDYNISFSKSPWCTEQEADAEEERLRKERENRKKQQAMTLEETREKLSQMEHELTELKNQKHQLFQDLKVVLNEDATRKRAQQMQQQNYQKERWEWHVRTIKPFC